MLKKLFFPSLMIGLLAISMISCQKDQFILGSDALVGFSADSLKFDTVFTSVGSVTKSFKIKNQNNQKIKLSEIKLMGGIHSAFNININGLAENTVNDVDIAPNDSIYIFVSVNIDPTTNNLPFIISDSIRISYNGNIKYVQLEAYGQNAHFLNTSIIRGNIVWTNDLPYVILGSLKIDSGASLTVLAGTKIFIHATAPIIVDGSLLIRGQKNNEVVLTGDRLDPDYKDLPASWPGIYINKNSIDNDWQFAIIKNANQAIVVQGTSNNNNPKLLLTQCIVDNSNKEGILSINSSIDANNCLISNCRNNIRIIEGGTHHFINCTVVSYSNSFFIHDNPVLELKNFNYDMTGLVVNNLTATFQNCIFWGDYGTVENEINISKEGTTIFDININHCIYKTNTEPTNATLQLNLSNINPEFDSVDVVNKFYDFRTTKSAFAAGVDAGILTNFYKDLDNNPRFMGVTTDIGCYEKQ